jgi:hypothetical protein
MWFSFRKVVLIALADPASPGRPVTQQTYEAVATVLLPACNIFVTA